MHSQRQPSRQVLVQFKCWAQAVLANCDQVLSFCNYIGFTCNSSEQQFDEICFYSRPEAGTEAEVARFRAMRNKDLGWVKTPTLV
jgi:hypothetical protein